MKYAIAAAGIAVVLSVLGIFYWYHTQQHKFIYPNPRFAGVYRCEGYDPYLDRTYGGTVTIIPQDAVYRLTMEYDTGEKYRATAGLFNPDTLAIVFQDLKDLQKVGLERYAYSKDRTQIQGYWVYLGESKLGKEVCVRTS